MILTLIGHHQSPPQGARNAVTRGKESSNSSWRHGSTCANVKNMQVTGSLTARLTARRGEIWALCGYCKPGSKPDSRCHNHTIIGQPLGWPLDPRGTRRDAPTSMVDRLDGPHNPWPTRARVPTPIAQECSSDSCCAHTSRAMSVCPDMPIPPGGMPSEGLSLAHMSGLLVILTISSPHVGHHGPYMYIVAHIHTHVYTCCPGRAHPPDLGKSQHVMTWWDNLDMSDTG